MFYWIIGISAAAVAFLLWKVLLLYHSVKEIQMQIEEKLELDMHYPASSIHPVLWKNGYFAQALHSWFINRHLKTDKWEALHMGKKEMGMTRFSINAILWFGEEMRKFSGIVPGDDEEFMSCIYPTLQGKANAWNGDAVAAHFAFFTQREQLDKWHILEQYGEICHKHFSRNEQTKEADEAVQAIMGHIRRNEAELLKAKSPYKSMENRKTMRECIKKRTPDLLLDILRMVRDERRRKASFSDKVENLKLLPQPYEHDGQDSYGHRADVQYGAVLGILPLVAVRGPKQGAFRDTRHQ